MKLKIDNKILVEAELDVKGFKEQYVKTFNLEGSVLDNIKIIKKEGILEEKDILNQIFYFSDWGMILVMLHERPETKIKFRICEIEYQDKVQYYPGVVEELEFNFNEKRLDGKMVIVINDLITNNNNFETWINFAVPSFCFVNKTDWIPLMGENDDKS